MSANLALEQNLSADKTVGGCEASDEVRGGGAIGDQVS
jgi:hypothetical protein